MSSCIRKRDTLTNTLTLTLADTPAVWVAVTVSVTLSCIMSDVSVFVIFSFTAADSRVQGEWAREGKRVRGICRVMETVGSDVIVNWTSWWKCFTSMGNCHMKKIGHWLKCILKHAIKNKYKCYRQACPTILYPLPTWSTLFLQYLAFFILCCIHFR